MLTYRTGIAGSPSAAQAMTAHLLELTVPAEHAVLAAYYAQGVEPEPGNLATITATVAQPRRDLDPAMAALLKLDPTHAPTAAEIAHLLAGNRADGSPIPGKQKQRGTLSLAAELGLDPTRIASPAAVDRILKGCRADTGETLPVSRVEPLRSRFLALYGVKDVLPSADVLDHVRAGRSGNGSALREATHVDSLTASRAALGFVDIVMSADKNLSVAYALAPTEAERALLLAAHRGAVADTMRRVEYEIGRARRGKGGQAGFDHGAIAWLTFEHMTARPTVEIVRTDPVTGEAYTQIASVPTKCNPQLHSHVLIPNCVLVGDQAGTPSRVGGLDLARLNGRVHELGALYQAFSARRLRRLGVEVRLDEKTGAARLVAVPDTLRDLFSDRTVQGTAAARDYAQKQGLAWDALDPAYKVRLLKFAVQDPRGAKKDGLADFVGWREKAAAAGWQPVSIIALDTPVPVPDATARMEIARQAALPLLDAVLRNAAVIDESAVRLAAARGLIAAGIEADTEVDTVAAMIVSGDVRQDDCPTRLVAERVRGEHGHETVRYTTTAHIEREIRLVALAREAAADRSQALSAEEIHAAAADSGLDFTSPHGRAQLSTMLSLGTGGRVGMGIGAAGSGKTTLLDPLVSAWRKRDRAVYGVAVAWRQAQALADAGIPPNRCLALAALLTQVRTGTLVLGSRDIVVVDEVSLMSSSLSDLARRRWMV